MGESPSPSLAKKEFRAACLPIVSPEFAGCEETTMRVRARWIFLKSDRFPPTDPSANFLSELLSAEVCSKCALTISPDVGVSIVQEAMAASRQC